MSRELTPQETAERSLIKTYRKSIWNPFIAAVKRYELIEPGDRIAVCISGGKDSVILAKLMQELQRHTSQPFELVFMVMDPGYKPENRKLIEDNAALLGIPITIFDSDIFDVTVSVEKNPCYLCARMRRGFLYAKAQEPHAILACGVFAAIVAAVSCPCTASTRTPSSHGRTTTTCNSSSAPAGSRRSGRQRGTAWAAASGRRSNSCCGS